MRATDSFARVRLDRIDALRALAMLWMTAYHLAFDLRFFGWLDADFYRDPFWTLQRTAIVSLFLFCAGLGQAVAHAQGQGWPRFWRRWAQVAGLKDLGAAVPPCVPTIFKAGPGPAMISEAVPSEEMLVAPSLARSTVTVLVKR